jgi:hypothetical protein
MQQRSILTTKGLTIRKVPFDWERWCLPSVLYYFIKCTKGRNSIGWKYNINQTSNYNCLSIEFIRISKIIMFCTWFLTKMIDRMIYYWIWANLRLQSISILTTEGLPIQKLYKGTKDILCIRMLLLHYCLPPFFWTCVDFFKRRGRR